MTYGRLSPVIALAQCVPTVPLRDPRQNVAELIQVSRVHDQVDIGMRTGLVRTTKRWNMLVGPQPGVTNLARLEHAEQPFDSCFDGDAHLRIWPFSRGTVYVGCSSVAIA